MSQRRNKEKLKLSWDIWKWKYNIPKLWDAMIEVLRGKFKAINAYIKKKNLNKQTTILPQGTRKRTNQTQS